MTEDYSLSGATMFGINRITGELRRYDFDTASLTTVGVVHNSAGQTMAGIDASAYMDGFHQIHAFWKDSATDHWKMILIDPETAEASVTSVDLGEGRVSGAVAVIWEDLSAPANENPLSYKVYAVQNDTSETANNGIPGLAGKVNLNPNNNPDYLFELTLPDGSVITRDNLHSDTVVDANGTAYEGPAPSFMIRPQGNGNQNGLTVNGELFPLVNSTTYTFSSSDMTVRLYNDKVNNGKNMGHWWLTVLAPTITITYDGTTINITGPTSRLLEIDTRTGTYKELMKFTRPYDSLASYDGHTFYATYGQSFFRIDRSALMETTLISNNSANKTYGLEFCGSQLYSFENVNNQFNHLDAATGEPLESPTKPGMSNIGTIVFMKTNEVPARKLAAVD